MVFDITTLSVQELPEEVEETIPDPSISTEVAEDEYGKFVIEPPGARLRRHDRQSHAPHPVQRTRRHGGHVR